MRWQVGKCHTQSLVRVQPLERALVEAEYTWLGKDRVREIRQYLDLGVKAYKDIKTELRSHSKRTVLRPDLVVVRVTS